MLEENQEKVFVSGFMEPETTFLKPLNAIRLSSGSEKLLAVSKE